MCKTQEGWQPCPPGLCEAIDFFDENKDLKKQLSNLQEACNNLVLTWRCKTCGWQTTLPTPGFGGNGFNHYIGGNIPCGPIYAYRVTER